MSPSPPSSTRTDTLFPDTTLFRTDRSYFLDELRHLGITRATDPGPISAAVLYLDLDDFKPVNDAHGHLVGDHVLEEVARRLRQCVRPSDVVARLGGDERSEEHTSELQSLMRISYAVFCLKKKTKKSKEKYNEPHKPLNKS